MDSTPTPHIGARKGEFADTVIMAGIRRTVAVPTSFHHLTIALPSPNQLLLL